MKTINEIMNSGKLSDTEIIAIIERNKTQARELAKKIELRKTNITPKSSTPKEVEGAQIVQKGDGNISIIAKDGSKVEVTVGRASTPGEAGKVLDDASTTLQGDAQRVARENSSSVKRISQKGWDKIKGIRRKLSRIWLWKLGLLAGGGYVLYKLLFGDSPNKKQTEPLNTCMTDLMDDDNSVVTTTSNGDLIVRVNNTGNPIYDSNGGLVFYPNGRVFYGNMKKRGTWVCNAGVISADNLQEQSTSRFDVNKDVTTMIDLLDFPVTYQNLYNAVKLLKKYVGKPEGKKFLDLYSKSGIGPGGIKTSIKFVYATKPETVQAKEKLLSIVNQIENQPAGDGNRSTGIKNISITWDDDATQNQTPKPETTPSPVKKTNEAPYHDCSNKDFPFEFGCINPKIGQLQKCLGVNPTKGYFGPKTRKALRDLQYDVSKGITKEMFDSIINSCDTSSTGKTQNQTTTGDTEPTLQKQTATTSDYDSKTDNEKNSIAPPPTPEQPQFSQGRLNELLASQNLTKKRKGEIVKWIGDELEGNDYYILNKYLTDKGYVQVKQREIGNRDDEDVKMKYKWKFIPKDSE